MRSIVLLIVTLFTLPQASAGESNVLVWEVDKNLETSYDIIYKNLENNKFFVVFEPNIQRNLARFSERWGEDYNRNKLEGIRAMVFCNAWYANAVGNADPQMMALCPLHITLIQQDTRTRILFARPSVVAAGSPALNVARELESDVVKALDQAVAELGS